MIAITLPWAPSVNRIWRNVTVGKRKATLLSEQGRSYRQAVALHCMAARVAGRRLAGRLAVTITVNPPDKRKRDIDNLAKAPLDALTHAGLWLDDSQIDKLSIERGPVTKGGQIHITISTIGA